MTDMEHFDLQMENEELSKELERLREENAMLRALTDAQSKGLASWITRAENAEARSRKLMLEVSGRGGTRLELVSSLFPELKGIDAAVLYDLYKTTGGRTWFASPKECGGTTKSGHSSSLPKLVKLGLADEAPRASLGCGRRYMVSLLACELLKGGAA